METDRRRPLEGKRVVVTRAPEQGQELIGQLELLGAEVLLLPAIRFSDPEETGALDAALRLLASFDWLLFTSANAVRFFSKRCHALGLGARGLQSPRPMVAAVGPATAQAAAEAGLRVDYVAARHSGESLGEELWGSFIGRRILLPRSDRAGDDLPAALRSAGAEVAEVVAYRTCLPGPSDGASLERIRRGDLDVLTFASPSAFHHFADILGAAALGHLRGRVRFAAIGPTTAGAIREAGLPVEIESAEPTAAGLAAAIAGYFERLPSGVKAP